MTSRSRRSFVPVLLLAASLCAPVWSGEVPVPLPGKALVYFVRQGRFGGSAGSIYVFADQTFATTLPNGSYGYAQLDPGHRLFWTTWTKATREIDLVPGETYYLDIWREVTLVDSVQGAALVEKVHDLAVPDEGERAKAANYIAKKYDKAVAKEGKRELAPVAGAPVEAAAPGDTEGMVHIPAYTHGVLEFLETVTTEFSPAGSPVHFRLVEDVVVDGEIIAHAGRIVTGVIRESSAAGGGGKAGLMDVVVPTLTTEAGVVVPLIAQAVGTGKDNESGAAAGGVLGGIMGAMMVRGREAFHLAGERLKVWTREDAWIRPRPPAPETPPDATATGPAREIAARVPGALHFKPSKGYKPDDVVVVLETRSEEAPVEASIVAVDDFTLPQAVVAKSLRRRDDAWNGSFDGWSVIRYLKADREEVQNVCLTGRLADGSAFTAMAAVRYQVER